MVSASEATAIGKRLSDSAMAEHRKKVEWGVQDFIGKFHLSKMTTPHPLPGTATRIEQERNAFMEKRTSSLKNCLDKIEARRHLRVKSRTRKAAVTARVEVQATVGYRIDAVHRMYQSASKTKKGLLNTGKYQPDKDFRAFLGYVETNNVYQVRSILRNRSASEPGANRLVLTAEEKGGNTPLHRAVSLGFVEISSVLLEAGADIDALNAMGDAPIHCCWRFWKSDTGKHDLWRKNPYLMVTKQMQADFQRMARDIEATISLLRLLTQGGADVDTRRNNGEVTLHTAARQGPFMSLWILLLSQAAHDIVDHRGFTPESAAVRAGKKDAATLLANWSVARQKYRNSEFVQEWMRFLCDPKANLNTDLTAKEVLELVRMEEHEGSTAVRARGGHLLVDEVITGPVLDAEERMRAKLLEFSASDSVSMSTALENSSTSICPSGAMSASDGGSISGPRRAQRNDGNTGGGTGGGGKRREDTKREAKKDHKGESRHANTTKSKLGKEIDVYLAQARDESASVLFCGAAGESTAYSRLAVKEQLEGRRNRWPRPRDNGKDPPTGGVGSGSSADPFGRPVTTRQRRRIAALEIADDGGVAGPLVRAATSSVLLTARFRAAKMGATPHPFYGRKLLTQRLLNQREREASIKPTATIGMHKSLDEVTGGRKRALYLNGTRTAFNDHALLPGPRDPGEHADELGLLHAQHSAMRWRKLHERPFCELQGTRKHNENVYCSALEDYKPSSGWTTLTGPEPLLPVRSRAGP